MSFKKYKLKDLVDSFSVRARDYGGSDGLEFLGVSNEDGIVKSKSAAEHKGEEYKIIEKGCFAYNPYRINIGSIAYHNEDTKGLISPAYVIFKTKPNSIKDNLLFKFLKSAEGLRQIRFHARGTVRQALRFEDLCKIEISIPTFEEQEGLISNIENTEFESNLISSELTHQLDLIKQLRQAFLREAMQGKLVKSTNTTETGQQLLAKIKAEKVQLIAEKKLKKEKELLPVSEEEVPFEIPEHWAWCRLLEVCDEIIDCPHSTPNYINTESNYFGIDTNCINEKGEIIYLRPLSLDSYNSRIKRLRPTENDIIYAREGSIGLSTILPKGKNICLGQRVMLFRASKIITSKFLKLAITEKEYLKRLLSKHRGMGAKHVNVSDIKISLLPLPPLHEQEQIVSKLEELMVFCDGLEKGIKESQGYNEMLLQQVLREALQGEIRE
jgi:type I restriction enzyme S subunit